MQLMRKEGLADLGKEGRPTRSVVDGWKLEAWLQGI